MFQFPVGKLNSRLLEELIGSYTLHDRRVVVGPKIGEDAAVIEMGERYVVLKSDPVTLATHDAGWYVVNVNANDVATMGARPMWFLATILLPEKKTDEEMVRGIFHSIVTACEDLDIALCGGHTEVTAGLDRPIISGHMAGEVERDKLVVNSNAMIGDDIILTKGIAIEGTAIIGREKERELIQTYDPGFVKKVKEFLYMPGISVVKEALLANETCNVHAMHDLTEGGLYTGLLEIAQVAGTGLLVDIDQVYCYRETEVLCARYHLDPFGVIASGSLLIVLDQKDTKKVKDALIHNNINCSTIGKLTDKKEGLKILKGGKAFDMPVFDVDEITRIY